MTSEIFKIFHQLKYFPVITEGDGLHTGEDVENIENKAQRQSLVTTTPAPTTTENLHRDKENMKIETVIHLPLTMRTETVTTVILFPVMTRGTVSATDGVISILYPVPS